MPPCAKDPHALGYRSDDGFGGARTHPSLRHAKHDVEVLGTLRKSRFE